MPKEEQLSVKFSLKWQFSIIIGAAIMLVTIIVSQIILAQERAVLTSNIVKQGYLMAYNLASIARESILTEDELPIYNAINELKKERYVEKIFLLNRHGVVLAHSELDEKDKTYSLDRYKVQENKGKLTPNVLVEKIKNRSTHLFDFAVPINASGEGQRLLGYAHIMIDKEIIDSRLRSAGLSVLLVTLIFLVLGTSGSIFMGNLLTKPVVQLTEGARIIGKGDLTHKIKIARDDELGLLAEQFNKMTTELASAQKAMIERERLAYELNIATDIQHSLIPSKFPKIPGISFGAYYQSAKEVGGDYFDVFAIDDEKIGLVIADVSGKGVPGSLVMVMTRSIIKAQARMGHDARETLVRTNALLYEDIKPGMFVSAFYGILTPKDNSIDFAIAGHDPMVVYRAKEKKLEIFKTQGFALGVKKNEIFAKKLESGKCILRKGDMMVQYTDGIPESMNSAREEFGMDHFHDVITHYGHLPCQEFIDKLNEEIKDFVKEAEQFDDIAIITVKIT